MSGGFKRSSRFGIIGVFVVAALCAAIGLTMGENPTTMSDPDLWAAMTVKPIDSEAV
jgi:hypothetical protein